MKKTFDEILPFAGPCAFCGHPDKRHRMVDTLGGRVRAGDSIRSVAKDMGFSVSEVKTIINQK